jgi:arginase family enzyme
MPAVDYRLPDGFSWSDVTSVLRAALASGRAVGLEVTIYNPELDEDGNAGRELQTSWPWHLDDRRLGWFCGDTCLKGA